MAVFTNIIKKRLSWSAPEPVTVGLPEVDFLFSDGSDFFFSDGSDYVFIEGSNERTPTNWTVTTKSSYA